MLAEPALTGEPLDWREIHDILGEYAEAVGWSGPLTLQPGDPLPPREFRLDVRPEELAGLETASPAVRQTVSELLARFLPVSPAAADRLERGRVKKLANRSL